MNVRIYQINMKRDANNVAFMNYESLPKFQGSSEIDSSLYDKVFEGEVNCFTLEKLYEIFNLKHPAGYKGRSMSVSDVVEIIDGNIIDVWAKRSGRIYLQKNAGNAINI